MRHAMQHAMRASGFRRPWKNSPFAQALALESSSRSCYGWHMFLVGICFWHRLVKHGKSCLVTLAWTGARGLGGHRWIQGELKGHCPGDPLGASRRAPRRG